MFGLTMSSNKRQLNKFISPYPFMKIRDLLPDSRPRERLKRFGIESLSTAELFALILKTGTFHENVVDVATNLINTYPLNKLPECSLKELQKINGIGFAKACQIQAIFEINKRKNTQESTEKPKKITCAEDVFNHFHDKLKDKKQEEFWILMLNIQNNIIGEQLISKGILDATIIHSREVFKPAIKNSASKIILVHNHPSGDVEPSAEDLEITEKLIKTGEEVGVKVVDGVIIGAAGWWSWLEVS